MAWLVRRAVILVLALGALLLSARLVGARQESWLALLFTNPDGSPCRHPCLFGAQPGRMASDEMLTALRAHPVTRSMRLNVGSGVADFVLEAQGVTIVVGAGAGWVNLNRTDNGRLFDTLPPAPASFLNLGSFGEVIATFGPPGHVGLVSGISFWDQFPAVVSHYPGRHLQFIHRRIPSDMILPDAPLAQIMVWPDTAGVGIQADAHPWSGFGRANRYPFRP